MFVTDAISIKLNSKVTGVNLDTFVTICNSHRLSGGGATAVWVSSFFNLVAGQQEKCMGWLFSPKNTCLVPPTFGNLQYIMHFLFPTNTVLI